MHCISKSNTAMVAESHRLLKQLPFVPGKNSSCVILFSFLTVSKAVVHGFAPQCVRQIYSRKLALLKDLVVQELSDIRCVVPIPNSRETRLQV